MGAIFGIIIISMIAVCAILFQMGHVWIAVLAICISLIICACFGIIFWILKRRHMGRLQAGDQQWMLNDPDYALLTTQDADVVQFNAHAHDWLGLTIGDNLTTLLGTILANPDPVLFQLLNVAQSDGCAKDEIVTRSHHLKISVIKISDDRFFWRIENLGQKENAYGRHRDLLNIPLLTVGARGAVLFANEACRSFLGYRPKTVSDFLGDKEPVSGMSATITGAQGVVSFNIAKITGAGGRDEIYLIPTQDRLAPLDKQLLSPDWAAIEDLPVPLLKVAHDGEILESNRQARQLLASVDTDKKYMCDLLTGLGRPISDWVREAAQAHDSHLSQFLRGRGDNQDTFIQVTLNCAGLNDDPHLIAVLNDVTELKTLEAQFVQSQKMQAIGQLAGGVAHDFNNLLTAISGHCDLLLLRHDQGDQDYADLIQIHQNANRAASLVGQLLAFSRKQNLQPEVIDLRDTLSDLTHLLNRLVGEKVRLSVNHAADLKTIRADKRQLEQVMMNLVVNARDAMPYGGEIKVITENLTLSEQMVRDRAIVAAGDYVLVKVIDAGHGIPPEKLPKIFEPFYTTKRTGEGTGLGLSTAYGIVKQTGGFIFVDSVVDQGTEFTLFFPMNNALTSHKLPAKQKVVKPVTGSESGIILLVEDEAPVRAFASRALRLRGYTVLEADCAEAALLMLSDPDLAVDIFVTDVIMPGMDGPTWVREALINRPDTRVVFVSGYAEDAFGEDGPSIPNSVFLPKPFSLSDLTVTVREQLSLAMND